MAGREDLELPYDVRRRVKTKKINKGRIIVIYTFSFTLRVHGNQMDWK